MKARLTRLVARLGVDAIYFHHPVTIRYLTGFTGSASFLLVGKGFRLFFSDSRYAIQMKKEVSSDFETHQVGAYQPALLEHLKRLGVKKLAFEAQHLSYAEWKTKSRLTRGVQWIPMLDDPIAKWRMVKRPDELAILRKGTRLAARSWRKAMAEMREGAFSTDRAMALRLETIMGELGAEAPSFESIIAGGPNSALPHYRPQRGRLKEGGFLLTDYGVKYKGYHTDETITGFLGRPTAEHRKIHRTVLEAHDRAIDAVRAGVTAEKIDRTARKVIEDAGYGKRFEHSTGHGVGLEIHEAPAVAPNSKTTLKAGMVITVEPGIYIEGWGGVRIEDMVLVTRDGAEILTRIPKALKTHALDRPTRR